MGSFKYSEQVRSMRCRSLVIFFQESAALLGWPDLGVPGRACVQDLVFAGAGVAG